jgi:hypothetical protein
VCCVLCAVCYVLCAVCRVLTVCCALYAVYCMLYIPCVVGPCVNLPRVTATCKLEAPSTTETAVTMFGILGSADPVVGARELTRSNDNFRRTLRNISPKRLSIHSGKLAQVQAQKLSQFARPVSSTHLRPFLPFIFSLRNVRPSPTDRPTWL